LLREGDEEIGSVVNLLSKCCQNPKRVQRGAFPSKLKVRKKPDFSGFFDGSDDGFDRAHKTAPAHPAGCAIDDPKEKPFKEQQEILEYNY